MLAQLIQKKTQITVGMMQEIVIDNSFIVANTFEKNIKICLSKLYIGMYYEVHDVIKYMQKIVSVNNISGGHISNYVTVQMAVLCDAISGRCKFIDTYC